MKQPEFIKQYQNAHPAATITEILEAWESKKMELARSARQFEACKPGTVIHFCAQQGIKRPTFYKNKKKYLPLYVDYLKNHTKDG